LDKSLGVIERFKDPEILAQMGIGEKLGGSLIIMVLGLLTCIVVLTLIMIVIKIMHKLMESAEARAAGRSVLLVTSPVAGSVVSVAAAAGKTAAQGDLLATVSGPQGESGVCAAEAGKVTQIKVKAGDSVNVGDVLAVLEKKEAAQ
jgi:acetyl-CoA carboxylase biotin carboxyl carrier protein